MIDPRRHQGGGFFKSKKLRFRCPVLDRPAPPHQIANPGEKQDQAEGK
jgi:hypothetical protein